MTKNDILHKAKTLYLRCRVDEAFELFMGLAEQGVGEAMYFVGEIFAAGYGHVVQNTEEAKKWREKGKQAGSLLASLNTAYSYPNKSKKQQDICRKYFPLVLKEAQKGDVFAENEVSDLYFTATERTRTRI
jgi:TPR repeat protein